jgi:acyl-coenzyme A thioesterase PaaI-like protein
MNKYYQTHSRLKREHHGACMFNGGNTDIGDNLKISFDETGTLIGSFYCHEKYQGYGGILHGGIVAALTDAAMAQCLMGHGVLGYTGRMNLRYHTPVQTNAPLTIRCEITEQYKELYKVNASITQNGTRHSRVSASASFYRVN